MTQHTRTDAQQHRTGRTPRYRTRTVGAAPTTEVTAETVGVSVVMALTAVAVAMAVSHPTAASVVVAAVAGAALQRRYGERAEKRVGVTATSQG